MSRIALSLSIAGNAASALIVLSAAVIVLLAGADTASAQCTNADPKFPYVDVDNDGCFDDTVDSDSIKAALEAGTYAAPAGTSIVIPSKSTVRMPAGATADWTADNAIRVYGRIKTSNTGVTITAGTGPLEISRGVDAKGETSTITLNCLPACTGPVTIGDKAKIGALGGIAIASSGGSSYGEKVKIQAKGGSVTLSDDFSIVIGDGMKVSAPDSISVTSDLGRITAGEKVQFRADNAVTFTSLTGAIFGGRSQLRTKIGDVTVTGENGGTQDIAFGERSQVLAGNSALLHSFRDLDLGAGSKVQAAGETALSVVLLDAAQQLNVGRRALISAEDFIQLQGDDIDVPQGASFLMKNGDNSLDFFGSSSINIVGATIMAELVHGLVQPGATLTLSQTQIKSPEVLGINLVDLSAESPGICDVTGTEIHQFMRLDTSKCGTVVGP